MPEPVNPAGYQWMSTVKEFLDRSTRALTDADSDFAPQPDMFTVAGQLAHIAHTVDWFYDAVVNGHLDTDFEAAEQQARQVGSVTEARRMLDESFGRFIEMVGQTPADQWNEPFPADMPFFGGQPRQVALTGVEDHTAHHRGALVVYARLLGKVPPMPYMDGESPA
jgi:uncharacterized damage-inducible protein DinB